MLENEFIKNGILKSIRKGVAIEFPQVTLLDVTLRDGGFEISFDWEKDFIVNFIDQSLSCGIEKIEIGYIGGVKRQDGWYKGLAADISGEFVNEITKSRKSLELVAIITPWRLCRKVDFSEYRNVGLSLLRVAYNRQFAFDTWEVIKNAKQEGISVCLNITNIATYELDDLTHLIKEAATKGITKISLADTTSGLTRTKIAKLGPALVLAQQLNIELGFHGHDVLGLGNANAIQLIEMGITTVDVSFGGLGRGGRNLVMETWMLARNFRSGGKIISRLFKLSELISRTVGKKAQNLASLLFSVYSISPELLEQFRISSDDEQHYVNSQIAEIFENIMNSAHD